ncbi:MAG: pseudouridine synthase, partial [Leptonema sp. (in: bacteria)]
MEGIVLFNKPPGKTSAEITNYFKKLTKKKVGHGGTLDPVAQGLLIIGIGKYTKELTKFLKESRKTYIAKIVLGAVSDTYDSEGKIVATGKPIPKFSEIEKFLKSFVGEIEQTPPPYSAIKIQGKRASDLIREGK